MDRERDIEIYRKQYAEKSDAELIADKVQWQSASPAFIAISQIQEKRRAAIEDGKRISDEKRHLEIKGGLDALREPKFHWSTTPTFWVSVAVLIVAIATLIVSILAWICPRG